MISFRANWLVTVVIILLLAFSSWAIERNIANNVRAKISHSLTTVRNTTHLALKTWAESHQAGAVAWADSSIIRESASQLLAFTFDQSLLLTSPAQQTLRDWFEPLQKVTGYRGYFIVGPNHINMASSRDETVGKKNLLLKQNDFLEGIWAGKSAVSLPAFPDLPLADASVSLNRGLPSMFVAAPIYDESGHIIAIFMFWLDPENGFNNVLQQGRIGNTGETYAFNSEGRLISQSRYDDQLVDVGLLSDEERSILNIELRDPGVNLLKNQKAALTRHQQPLTLMANSAIQGAEDTNIDGYRDYRGVPVVGAWLWDEELKLGIATELDVEEAFKALNTTQLAITTLTILLILLLMTSKVIFSLLIRQRALTQKITLIEKGREQLYLDTIGSMVVELNRLGSVIRINKKGCEILGYSEEELIGKNWFTICLPKEQQLEVKQDFDRLIKGEIKGLDFYENEVVTRVGEHRLIAWHNALFRDEYGNITGTLSDGEDITDRKQTEKALRASEQYNRMLFLESSIGLALCDMDGKLVDVNPAYAAILGRTVKETIKLSYWDITPPEYFESEQLQLKRLKETGSYGPYEKAYIHADGHLVDVQLFGKIIEKGGEHYIWSSVEDITNRKKIVDELRQAAAVFENTNEAIVIADANANVIKVNRAFTTITGYEPNEVLYQNVRVFKTGCNSNIFYENVWGELKSKGQWCGEALSRRKSGEIYPTWESINAIKDGQGNIINYIAIFSNISLLKKSEQRLTYQAHHDPLTGLCNRLRFTANLEQAIASAKRHTQKIALLYLDLDRFKQINDVRGHSVGDQVLINVAQRLKNCVRAEDTVARMGGDEFTVVLTEINHAEDAGFIADKIVKAMCQPLAIDKLTFEISTSIGISIFPNDGDCYETLVKAADGAMYHAKALGKNNYQFFTAELASRAIEYQLIEQGLHKAVLNQELELYYQPQVSMSSGKIVGVEALIRWNHPVHGQLLPDHFIHIADDTNLIDAISGWVLRTVVNDYQNWTKKGAFDLRVAVNITGRQFSTKQSVKQILSILDELVMSECIPKLDLEITETALERTDRSIKIINVLRNRGIMFAIDDFGTGYSSLSRLKQLPIDTLKIDRSFIQEIASEGDDKAIAAAIIAMAHSLDLKVVAEGVETQSQIDVLRSLKCDEIQGFYFSKPVPANEISNILDKRFDLDVA